MAEQPQAGLPPLPIRLIARGLSRTMAHAPFLWPLLRRPTRRFWDKAAPQWDTGRAANAEARAVPLRAAVETLERDDPPARILELGTGTGTGAFVLAERFPTADITAVDLSDEMVAQAANKLTDATRDRVHFERADASSLPYPDGHFDLVCQLNLPLYASEMARVLAPGGTIVIAHTAGPRTPYYTPDSVLAKRFKRLGLTRQDTGTAGDGTYFTARRP